MKISLITFGAVAVAAITLNLNASAASLAPRAAGNQIIHTAGAGNDVNLGVPASASTDFAAPRPAGNKIVTTAVVNTAVNPATRCSASMTASPRAVQACASNPAMPCCHTAAR